MRSLTNSEIKSKLITINILDNSRRDWGAKKVLKIIKDSLPIIEKFIYSNKTKLTVKNNPNLLLDIHFCGDKRMRSINKDHRDKDKTTDVLSFPGFESLRSDRPTDLYPGIIHLGDIIVSREVALKQSIEFKITLEEEIIHLIIHGLLHLLGWDHEISLKEEKIMTDLENKILKDIATIRKK